MKVDWKEPGRVLVFEAETDEELSVVGYLLGGAALGTGWQRPNGMVGGQLMGAPVLRKPCTDEWTRSDWFRRSHCVTHHRPGQVWVVCGFELDVARLSYNAGPLPTAEDLARAEAVRKAGSSLFDLFGFVHREWANNVAGAAAGVVGVKPKAQE
ncbi:MAG: hypothetical protein HEQ39_09570 [Rhizobacter sp.]